MTDEKVVQDLWAKVFGDFVSEGWTVMIGLKPEFEANYSYQMGEFSIGELTPEYVRDLDDEEDYDLALEYILKHYVSVYD